MKLFKLLPDVLAALSDDDLRAYIAEGRELAAKIAASPDEYITEDLDREALLAEVTAGVTEIERAAAALAERHPVEEADEFAALAARADALEVEEPAPVVEEPVPAEEPAPAVEEPAPVEEPPVEPAPVEPAPVEEPPADIVASVARPQLPRPSRSRAAVPVAETPRVSLTAAAEGLGFGLGAEVPTEDDIANMMTKRRKQFGDVPEGTHGEKIPIVQADWSDLYGPERTLGGDAVEENWAKVQNVVDETVIGREMDRRRDESLTASGGLCAPVTPYYQLAMLATSDRPVRAALASFSADRGGIRFATPASILSVTTGVGTMTVAQDAAGGTTSQKSCQVVPCPPFSEVDVVTVYHCIQFGNLGARTFPERVAQWNSLVLAQHARVAETLLLDGISAASVQVTAGSLGLGATSSLLSQIITAANGQRSRQRMAPTTVLRALLPWWVLDLLQSDMFRTQFGRFDMSDGDFISLLRRENIEPSFYLDSATGKGQVFGGQGAGALLPFPSTVVWYLYPEGSFLYLDGGTLELGLVRDSVLNKTNDFQIFGESFENVAFVGVESLAVTSTVCDSGTVSLPKAIVCPIDYTKGS